MFNIEEELKKLPAKPGVYLMHDEHDTVIYVGKAKVLKNRVRQYFQSSRNVSPKIEKMISNIDHFEYIITDSEVEALVLESNLIKEYSPKYNTMLRDDKSYPFIKATVGEKFPRLFLMRSNGKLKNTGKVKYYGPYTSAYAAKDLLLMAQKIYHVRTCNKVLPRDTGLFRPCLNYHINQCKAPCQGYVSEEEYREEFNLALKFIEGDRDYCIGILTEKMVEASERMDFEEAAIFRDKIENIKRAVVNQKITDFEGVDKDVIACAIDGDEAVIQAFFIRQGKLVGRDNFHMDRVLNVSRSDIIQDFVKQFYSGTPMIPSEIMLEYDINDRELIEKWLSEKRGNGVHIKVPKKGQKERLVELAHKNAVLVMEADRDKFKRIEAKTTGAMEEICKWLNLDGVRRIESYDISHTSGFQSVGSMVVFQDGLPKKNDYRKFKLMGVQGNDDYASMEEILTRRFEHGLADLEENEGLVKTGFSRFPDLIMMDGGKGQVNVCLKVFEKLGIDIPVCGLVKDDKHRTRGIYYNNVELPIDTHSEGFWLITRIQDEVHRFAIEYHRSLRSKVQVKSVLDDIPLIGPKRRRALLKYFEGIERLKNASVEEIKQVESMDAKSAENVYNYFREDENKINDEINEKQDIIIEKQDD
ncbi:MAG: excinuclease ABC subunit UvrC [Lachnospiraceae bacterium]|nr:excinuclease ABC subunit UvrC [Lachnospiraceae bacterium]